MVDRACFLALGFLHQRSPGRSGDRNFVVARSGVPRFHSAKCRLARSFGRDDWSGWNCIWICRVRDTGLASPPRTWKFDHWVELSHCFCIRRKTRSFTYGSAFAFYGEELHCCESLDALALWCAWDLLFSLPSEFDPGPTL